jgi:hypothetical protein
MIINLNKFQKTNKLTLDLTNKESCIYFLISVDEKTPRYKRVNGEYIKNPNGNIVIDQGIDLFSKVPRVLKYIGETTYFFKRISEHYRPSIRKNNISSGIGPVFNYLRIIKGFKRFKFDTIRIHTETTLVRKYLPEVNKAAQLNEKQKLFILNSNGAVTPWDVSFPYGLHSRDIYRAAEAWKKEDPEYLKKEFVEYKMTTVEGIIHPNKRNPISYHNKNGKKYTFSQFVRHVLGPYHVKQVEAAKDFYARKRIYIKEYDPERYDQILKRDRKHNVKNYRKNKEHFTKRNKLSSILNKRQQPILL